MHRARHVPAQLAARPVRRRQVAIVGGGPTRDQAPYADLSWDIWAFSSRDWTYPRVTRWFEIHALTDLRQQLASPKRGRRTFPDYMRYLSRLRCPVYMQRVHPFIPTSVRFPKEMLVRRFGRCFTSTASFLVALAIAEGYDVIGLWGVDPKGPEYWRQRQALRYLLGIARQRGIRLVFPPGFSIDIPARPRYVRTPVLYAYDWRSPYAWWRYRLRKKAGAAEEGDGTAGRPGVDERKVYTVSHPTTGRRIVIKRYANGADAWHEYRVTRAFRDYTHLPRAYGCARRGAFTQLIREWVPGLSLDELIRQHGALPPSRVVAITLNVLRGLRHLHRRGYVHGDLHGENVIVDPETGRLKIIDFQHSVRKNRSGWARARRTVPIPPVRLAPESRWGWIDERYDIYGVGFMGACMLAGRVFTERPEETGIAVGGNRALWKVFLKAMHPQRSRRYRSATDMMAALTAIARLYGPQRLPGRSASRLSAA